MLLWSCSWGTHVAGGRASPVIREALSLYWRRLWFSGLFRSWLADTVVIAWCPKPLDMSGSSGTSFGPCRKSSIRSCTAIHEQHIVKRESKGKCEAEDRGGLDRKEKDRDVRFRCVTSSPISLLQRLQHFV